MSFLRSSMIWAVTIFLISISIDISSGDNLIQTGTYGSGDNFAGGSGTLSDPYWISNISDLQKMNSNLSAHYVIVNDIDASETYYWNNGSGFNPVGNISSRFNGSLDGQGLIITDLFINRSNEDFIGLFGYIGDQVVLKNISIIDCNITGEDLVGGLVGYNMGDFKHCSSSGIVVGYRSIGGLIGYNEKAALHNCKSSGIVSGLSNIGGFIGYNYRASLYSCSANGEVLCEDSNAGGLLGVNFDGFVINCTTMGNISGSGICIGGFIGFNVEGNVSICSASVNLTSEKPDVGGFIGYNLDGLVLNCSVKGKISGETRVGGFVGFNDHGKLSYCSAICDVQGTSSRVGGLIGYHQGIVTNCSSSGFVKGSYWSTGGLIGHNAGMVSNSSSMADVFTISWAIGGLIGSNEGDVSNSYSMGNVTGYKYTGGLIGENQGTVSDCYATGDVTSAFHYTGGLIGSNNNNVFNCSARGNISGYYSIGGLIGSNGRTVSDCNFTGSVSGNDCVGGIIGENNLGIVSNCWTNGNVIGGINVGGLVGYNYDGRISNSSSSGSVRGNWSIGGMVGYNFNGILSNSHTNSSVYGTHNLIGGGVGVNVYSEVLSCFSTGDVYGSDQVGGLVGYNNNSLVSNCYSLSIVSGNQFIGGLAGINYRGYIIYSYFAGYVKNGSNVGGLVGYFKNGGIGYSFWDNKTSGMNFTFTQFGRNTSDMMNKSTFTTAGWDFKNTWRIIDGFSYPYLRSINYGAPKITTEDVGTAYEGLLYLTDYDATSNIPGGREVIWNLTTNTGDWLSITKNGVLSGIPMNEDVGFYWVNISATIDDIRFDHSNFTLTVLNINNDPVINTPSLPDAVEDQLYNFKIDGIDIDPTNDIITWWMETNSSFLNINPYSGILSGIPDNDDVGTWSVRVSLFDGNGGYDNTSLSLTVINVNDDPQILPYELIDIFSDVPFFIDLDAVDIDPTEDTMEWSQRSNCGFASIDTETGNLTGIVPEGEFGEWWFNVTVFDGKGGSDWTNFTLSIEKENHCPILNKTDLTLYADEDSDGINLDLAEIFFDPDGDVLSFNYEVVFSLIVTFHDSMATIKPYPQWCGREIIHFTASDGEFSVRFNVTVIVYPVNDAPLRVSIISEPSYYEGRDQNVEATAFDYDTPYGDILTYRWESNISGVIGNGRSINLSLKAGIHLVTVTVTDSEGLSTSASKEIEILPEEIEEDPVDDEDDEDLLVFLVIIPVLILVLVVIVVYVIFKKRPVIDHVEE